MANHPNRSLRARVRTILLDNYPGLPHECDAYVGMADTAILRRVLELAEADVPGREIVAALGITNDD